MKHILPVVVAVVLLGAGTYYQGKLSDRWGASNSEILAYLTERIQHVPAELNEWDSEDTPLSAEEFKATGCTGYVSRVYKNRTSGEEVSVFVVTGTARHVTIHTPDWCYQGAGFKMEKEPYPYSIECGSETESPEFSTTTFVKQSATATQRLRIFWTYSDSGKWEGPRWPKPFFAGRPALVKVYLITGIDDERAAPEDSPSLEFAKLFMPEVNEVFFTTVESPDSTNDQAAQS